MSTERTTKAPFNSASKMTAREASLNARADKAIERLGARHEANQAQQVAKRFEKLMRSDRPAPSLKPHGAIEDRKGWLMRSALYQIKREHGARLNKVRDVAKAMSRNTPGQQQDKQRGRDTLAR
jgi:NADH:ubiquinone oxidoreductase subunit E